MTEALPQAVPSVRVAEAASKFHLAPAARQQVAQAHRKDELARRTQIEDLIRTALELGYDTGRKGQNSPVLSVRWNDDNRAPQLTFGVSELKQTK